MITGNEIVALGFKPAKWFKEALAHINKTGIEGNELLTYLKSVEPIAKPLITLHEKSVKYHINIIADTEQEKDNLQKVKETMEVLMKTPIVVGGAIMPDACPAGPLGTIPVGGVVITKNAIVPNFHSADICCSLMLTNLGDIDPKLVLDMAETVTHFGVGGRPRGKQFDLPIDIENEFKSNSFLKSEYLLSIAKEHLGTQGASNHFFYVGKYKSSGDTVIVTHHGSRGVGAILYKVGMKVAEKFRKEISPETPPMNAWIPFDTNEGKEYWEALQAVRNWTKQNHTVIHDEVCKKLSIKKKDRFWNEHNFVFKDGDLFYHAKGATPINKRFMPDITGPQIIPLNMSQPILLVEGPGTDNGIYFAPHGAGRNISRSAHKKMMAQQTSEEIFIKETKGIDVRFYSGQVDISELPSAYKNADEVKKQISHFGLANIVDEILPYGSLMVGHVNEYWRKNKKKK